MKERPILFSAPMVRALLAGRKTQTRRAIKPQPERCDHGRCNPGTPPEGPWSSKDGWHCATCGNGVSPRRQFKGIPCPYGDPGDLLWVKETLRRAPHAWTYGADDAPVPFPGRAAIAGLTREVITSIHCRRDCSRLTLRITDIRVERLNDCTEADALAEGVTQIGLEFGVPGVAETWRTECHDPRRAYNILWDSINGPGSWAANPWVWVIAFEAIQP
jgi:hypothetical protein